MHTKDGHDVNVGDRLWLEVQVTNTNATPDYCNCDVRTVEPMFPGTNTCSLVINTKQVVKEPPLVANFDFSSILDYGQKALNVLETAGDAGLDVVKQGFIMFKAITRKDLSGIFEAYSNGKRDVVTIIAAIKAEFGITE